VNAAPALRAALVALLAALAAGCVPIGRDFVRPTPASVELARTTPDEARAKLGPPRSERAWTRGDLELAKEIGTPFGAPRVAGTMTELYYYYEDRAGMPATAGVDPSRSALLWFWDGRLVGYRGSSSFKSDSTAFDEAKATAIKPWQTLRADVVAALGEPSGRRIYPLAPAEDAQVLTWFAFEYDTALRQSRTRTLHVLVNAIGVVVDVRYDSNAKPLPPPPPSTYTPVPIYIPPAKKK